jgi:hypothetical protein
MAQQNDTTPASSASSPGRSASDAGFRRVAGRGDVCQAHAVLDRPQADVRAAEPVT